MSDPSLSKRERQVMDVVYALGEATAGDVLARLADGPGRTAVRTFLRILEEKGHVTHRKKGREFVFRPTQPRRRVGRSALRRVLDVFFDGSLEKAIAAHLADPGIRISNEEARRLGGIIRQARERGAR